jgi:hypothetical protein
MNDASHDSGEGAHGTRGRMRETHPRCMSNRVAFLVAAAALCVSACAPAPSDETPLGALRMFLRAMERSSDDARALEEAYTLLDTEARDALTARARDASALANGREFAPWEMLAQGRYRVRFPYAEYGSMRESIDGERATVTVVGTDRRSRAEVPLVREEGHWRVVLRVPPPPAPPPAPSPESHPPDSP